MCALLHVLIYVPTASSLVMCRLVDRRTVDLDVNILTDAISQMKQRKEFTQQLFRKLLLQADTSLMLKFSYEPGDSRKGTPIIEFEDQTRNIHVEVVLEVQVGRPVQPVLYIPRRFRVALATPPPQQYPGLDLIVPIYRFEATVVEKLQAIREDLRRFDVELYRFDFTKQLFDIYNSMRCLASRNEHLDLVVDHCEFMMQPQYIQHGAGILLRCWGVEVLVPAFTASLQTATNWDNVTDGHLADMRRRFTEIYGCDEFDDAFDQVKRLLFQLSNLKLLHSCTVWNTGRVECVIEAYVQSLLHFRVHLRPPIHSRAPKKLVAAFYHKNFPRKVPWRLQLLGQSPYCKNYGIW